MNYTFLTEPRFVSQSSRFFLIFPLLLRCGWHITFSKFMVYNTVIWLIVTDGFAFFLFSPSDLKLVHFCSLILSLMPQYTSFSLEPLTKNVSFPIFHFHKLPSSQSEEEKPICMRSVFTSSSVMHQHSGPQKVEYKFILELHFPSWMYSKNHSSIW